MNPLPAGYRGVSAFLIIHATCGLQCCVVAFRERIPDKPGELLVWLSFVLSPPITIVGAFLLQSRNGDHHKVAPFVLFLGAVLSFVQAGFGLMELKSSIRHDGGCGVLLLPLLVIPASVAGVTMLVTAIRLLRRNR